MILTYYFAKLGVLLKKLIKKLEKLIYNEMKIDEQRLLTSISIFIFECSVYAIFR